MKSLFFLFLINLLSRPVLAVETGCFYHHVSDAIKLNSVRLPLYAQLSANLSRPVSEGLITSERETLVLAKYFDLRAEKYDVAGVPILCGGFISMSKASAFKSFKDMSQEPIEKFVHFNSREMEFRLLVSLKKFGFDGLKASIDNELEQLKSENYNCMLRHGLKSLRRFTTAAPFDAKLSIKKGLVSSETLSSEVIEAHIFSLPKLIKLDEMAAPLQARGIPILCQDLPPIP